MGPSSVIIHLKSYLFICLGDSNILHPANLSHIFPWENAIEKICSALENQHQKSPRALFKPLFMNRPISGRHYFRPHGNIPPRTTSPPNNKSTQLSPSVSKYGYKIHRLGGFQAFWKLWSHSYTSSPQTQSLTWLNHTLL